MKNLLFCICIISFITSCDKNRVYEKNIEVNDYVKGWNSQDKKSFEVELNDSTRLYNFYINVRHAEVYPFSNLWVMLSTKLPDGKIDSQRLEIPLADEAGNWYGDGMGDIWDYRFALTPFYIKQTGTYTISLAHDMRMDPLPGIMDIGVRIEDGGKKTDSPLPTQTH